MARRNKAHQPPGQTRNLIRSGAPYVFRDDPVTPRKFGSMYERRRRSTTTKKAEPVVKETVEA